MRLLMALALMVGCAKENPMQSFGGRITLLPGEEKLILAWQQDIGHEPALTTVSLAQPMFPSPEPDGTVFKPYAILEWGADLGWELQAARPVMMKARVDAARGWRKTLQANQLRLSVGFEQVPFYPPDTEPVTVEGMLSFEEKSYDDNLTCTSYLGFLAPGDSRTIEVPAFARDFTVWRSNPSRLSVPLANLSGSSLATLEIGVDDEPMLVVLPGDTGFIEVFNAGDVGTEVRAVFGLAI